MYKYGVLGRVEDEVQAAETTGYNNVRQWEYELIIALGETETAYYSRPLSERARLVAGIKLPSIMESLHTEKFRRERPSRI